MNVYVEYIEHLSDRFNTAESSYIIFIGMFWYVHYRSKMGIYFITQKFLLLISINMWRKNLLTRLIAENVVLTSGEICNEQYTMSCIPSSSVYVEDEQRTSWNKKIYTIRIRIRGRDTLAWICQMSTDTLFQLIRVCIAFGIATMPFVIICHRQLRTLV